MGMSMRPPISMSVSMVSSEISMGVSMVSCEISMGVGMRASMGVGMGFVGYVGYVGVSF
jgi:hypothetical protein